MKFKKQREGQEKLRMKKKGRRGGLEGQEGSTDRLRMSSKGENYSENCRSS